MKKTLFLLGGLALLLGAACTPGQVEGLQTLVAALPGDEALLGGQVAALPTPDPDTATTPTPPSSAISFPTPAPAVNSPLAALTQIAGLVPTLDLSATPYAIALQGRPHFVEFHAWW